jgi:hypothetical protein
LTDTSHTQGPLPPPPPRSGPGCLSGCLLAGAIALVVIVGAISYFGWYFYSGFKDNPTLHSVMRVVNGDVIARSVLGDHIEITNLESSSFSEDTTSGKHVSFVAHLRGSRGEGTLAATVDTTNALDHITSMVLTGPDGRTYDLTSSQSQAPPGSI